MRDLQTARLERMHARNLPGIAAGALLCLSLSACTREETLPKETLGAFEQAFTRDDLAACVALFTDDAEILPEHGPAVEGRAAIEKFIKDSLSPVILFDTQTELVVARGDLAVEQGTFRIRDVRHGTDVELGKYLHVWRKTSDGWKLFRVIYNTNYGPETQVSVEPTTAGS